MRAAVAGCTGDAGYGTLGWMVEAASASERHAAGRFPCFDGLRAIAALSVFAYHFLTISHPPWLRGSSEALVSRLGQQGVGVFFVISGFLLYRPFVDAALRGIPSPHPGRFWLRRFVRIFPAYWIALTAFVTFFGLFAIHGFANIVTYYGLLQNYRGGYALSGLGVAWTLVIEVSFYIALPFIDRIGRALTGSAASIQRVFRAQTGLIATLAAIGFSVRALNIWVVKTAAPGAWFPLHASGYSLFAYLDWFAIGMAFALISAASARTGRHPKSIAAASRHTATCWLIAGGGLALQARVMGPTLVMTGLNPFVKFLVPGLVGITAGFFVLPAAFGNQDEGAARRFLRMKPVVYLGGISYGIYLWHWIIIRQSSRWISNSTLTALMFRFVVVFSLTVAIASASFYVVEKPLIGWSHGPARRKSPSPHRIGDGEQRNASQ
jgi:peptidoglycan/LPS O-acetylase OafA/YrhL